MTPPNADGSGTATSVREIFESVIPFPLAVTGERIPKTSKLEISVSKETVWKAPPPNETEKSKPFSVFKISRATSLVVPEDRVGNAEEKDAVFCCAPEDVERKAVEEPAFVRKYAFPLLAETPIIPPVAVETAFFPSL